MQVRLVVALLCALGMVGSATAQTPPSDDAVELLLKRLEGALQTVDRGAYEGLFSPAVPGGQIETFAADLFVPDAVRTVVRERDRAPLEGAPVGDGHRLVVELFIETAGRARILTTVLNIRRPPGGAASSWKIVGAEGLTALHGLYQLRVNATTQLAARNLVVTAEDVQITLPEGQVFLVESAEGTTGLVLLGRGEMRFSPAPAAEKGQTAIFAGSETLVGAFDSAFVRMNPSEYVDRVTTERLTPMPLDTRRLRRAQEVFDRESPRSYSIDLEGLSTDTWYLLPPLGDFVAEVQTRRWGALTYSRTGVQAEDIALFARDRNRTVSMYTSAAKVAARGRFYNTDDFMEYDVSDYNIEAQISPDTQSIEGQARLAIRVRVGGTNTLTLRLHDAIDVSSVVSLEFGRLLHLRVRNQHSVIVSLPATLSRDTDVTLVVSYSGHLPSQDVDREAVQTTRLPGQEDSPLFAAEPNYLLSSRSYWYPQNPVGDYATATIRLTVPRGYGCVASGQPVGRNTEVTLRDLVATPGGTAHLFRASEPLRYLAFVVSRFSTVAQSAVSVEPDGRPRRSRVGDHVALAVEANPRLRGYGREILGSVEDIVGFYASLVGDVPYPSLTLALTEDALPGGHSPGYFAMVNTPPPQTPFTWGSDPATFGGFPDFFVAHELAHQWWGQAIGWMNYHEQWLSEGFAQYFAALYARHTRGEDVFVDMLRHFRRWALAESDQGPVYLGYRLGHIKNNSRTFRALVYNKGASVLHMLRMWLGDEVFFRALKRFYDEQKFRKTSTEDFRRVLEAESGRSLERFFERWIYGAEVPAIRYHRTLDGRGLIVRFEQTTDLIFDLPVTVTVTYTNGRTLEVVVPITDRVVEAQIPVSAPVRQIRMNLDYAALANFEEF